ncbi:MAG: glucose-1-phosphate cytidylyltransferase [Parcubacteria group bacterium]|jgi:glucose-1-phosphate cytidylyltransferase|nr:glucose-1-phosphate cytidylyltransferase [Parcubacteria group bacterium]HJN56410.1 sugar phosphate nucleotidyltransferase [Candidatus Woesearchaeota archaeon]|tara:strand:+ start:938 stop:1630 length:693 start_codon:yes stop_codon:yes gene_type:complete
MHVVILCGGKGTRLNEYTEDIPKPLVEIGNKPILHHLMSMYAAAGYNDFILCLGYKGDKIKEYFNGNKEFNIEFADTGEDANKAERLMKVKDKIKGDNFLLSYGDDLSDVDINKVIEFHKKNKKIVTLAAVHLVSPFGIMEINEIHEVTSFKEKPKLNHLMNGGFYVIEKEIFNYIKPGYDLEKETFEDLAKAKQITAFKHNGFWKSMNTLKDVIELNEMFEKGDTPWIK